MRLMIIKKSLCILSNYDASFSTNKFASDGTIYFSLIA